MNIQEELKGQLAESLPAAVQIFADALTDGDVAKLFDQMEDGKLKIDALNKVINHMAELTDEDLLGKMMNTPAKALERLNTAWQRFIMAVNSAGLTDAMVFALDTLADGVILLTKAFKGLVPVVKQVWNVLQPLLVIMGGLFVYGRILKLVAAMKAMKVGLAGAAVVTDRLIKAQFLLGAALYKVQQILKRSFVVVGFLAIIDLIETLQGKQTVLTNMLSQGGWIANIAKTLIAIGRVIELSMNGLIALFTGDFEYASVALEKFKKDMLDLFPFDMWWEGFTSLLDRMWQRFKLFGEAAKLSLNPFSSSVETTEAWRKYDLFKNMQYLQDMSMTGFNPVSAAMAPTNLARQNPNVTTHMNVTIPINGTGLDPQAISKAVAEQLNITFMQSQSNYVMRNGAK